MSSMDIDAAGVAAALHRLGVEPGDSLIVHCALTSLGKVEGGAGAVIEAILGLIGTEGTLLVPALTDLNAPFAVESSPSTVGGLSEALRKRPEARRSCHPTHSVVAVGGQAETLTAGHEHTTPCGPGSPYARLCAQGGWVLLLGVDQDRSTTWHAAEDVADVPYLTSVTMRAVGSRSAPEQLVRVNKYPFGHREFIKWDRSLYEMGAMRIGQVGRAVARLVDARRMLDFGVQRLQEDPAAFLCEKQRCIFCQWARSKARQVADERDWSDISKRWGCGDPTCEVCNIWA